MPSSTSRTPMPMSTRDSMLVPPSSPDVFFVWGAPDTPVLGSSAAGSDATGADGGALAAVGFIRMLRLSALPDWALPFAEASVKPSLTAVTVTWPGAIGLFADDLML